jgi:ABC-type transport system involved in Fe-S cluster assembly fused permease/ATPase subunit
LGKPDATDEEIIEALKIANAFEFVKILPKGIHTNIGDSGNKLSGGQKQRLSILRAVLKKSSMILDPAGQVAVNVHVNAHHRLNIQNRCDCGKKRIVCGNARTDCASRCLQQTSVSIA